MRRNIAATIGIAACLVFLSGCSLSSLFKRPKPSDIACENPPVVRGTEAGGALLGPADGSLFDPRSTVSSPWSDDTARGVGDIVSVTVSVSNEGEHSATTELTRESEINAGVDSLLGYENSIPGVGKNNTTGAQLIKSSSSNSFAGNGDTKRTGSLTAEVSAIVTQVYPNGNMRIHGSQSLLVNNEDSIVTVDGVIRPSDVSSENVVTSERIAEARIEIAGRGVVSDKQRPGILMRAFDWFWWF